MGKEVYRGLFYTNGIRTMGHFMSATFPAAS